METIATRPGGNTSWVQPRDVGKGDLGLGTSICRALPAYAGWGTYRVGSCTRPLRSPSLPFPSPVRPQPFSMHSGFSFPSAGIADAEQESSSSTAIVVLGMQCGASALAGMVGRRM